MANLEAEVHAAKAFLLQSSTTSNQSLYDHLAECLTRVLTERPKNGVDHIEEISRIVKREKVKPQSSVLQEPQSPSKQAELAQLQKPLFTPSDASAEADDDEEVSVPFPDLMASMNCFEQGGIGLDREESYQIYLALKQLTVDEQLASVRFWGKMFGMEANYIIAEAEYQEGQEEEEEEEEEKDEGEGEGAEEKEGEDEEGEEKDEPPKSQWKPPPKIPRESNKTGTNKKTFFVCNQAGEKWVKLPPVTPAQIVAARQIRKLMTGRLNTPILTYPPFPDCKNKFPGLEENYLRAQIARISATTHISPKGYYQFEEDEEDGDDEEESGVIEVNKEFEIPKIGEYADGSMTNWDHHVEYILPQGRCTWFNPVQKADDQFDDDEDEEEDKEQPDEPLPESGPKLLTSVAEDATVNGMPAWSARLSSNIVPQYAVAIVSSNLWPGAHAFAVQKKFDNIYIGWGQKYSPVPFNPSLPPQVQEEFPAGPEITEASDPTVTEEEAAAKKAQEEAEAEEEEEEPEDSDDD